MDIQPLERARDYPDSILRHVIPNESEITGGVTIEPGKSYGFFTDTTVCIGCKACEVACKEWNNLPAEEATLTGHSYDNTGALSANTWRHVSFIEKKQALRDDPAPSPDHPSGHGVRDNAQSAFQSGWLMMSDVCKHCHHAPCMEACPTGALFKTEFDTVVVQQDICNGCGYCVPACPFGVVEISDSRRQGPQVHPVLRPAEGRAGAGLRQVLPHREHPVRRAGRPAGPRPRAGGAPARARRGLRLPLRHAWRAGGHRRHEAPERLLPADRSPGSLQPARRPHPALAAGGSGPARRAGDRGGAGGRGRGAVRRRPERAMSAEPACGLRARSPFCAALLPSALNA